MALGPLIDFQRLRPEFISEFISLVNCIIKTFKRILFNTCHSIAAFRTIDVNPIFLEITEVHAKTTCLFEKLVNIELRSRQVNIHKILRHSIRQILTNFLKSLDINIATILRFTLANLFCLVNEFLYVFRVQHFYLSIYINYIFSFLFLFYFKI